MTLRIHTMITALVLLAGCSSSPAPDYYLLQPSQSELNLAAGVSVGLHPVAVPVYLQRSSLLVGSDDGLRYSEQGRWGEPLADGIYRVSVMDLAARLSTGQFRTWPWSADDRPDVEVILTVLAMERRATEAWLTVDVGIKRRVDGSGKGEWQHLVQTWKTAPTDRSDSASASAYSDLVRAMNADIAARIQQLSQGL